MVRLRAKAFLPALLSFAIMGVSTGSNQAESWHIGTHPSEWQVEYDGFGSVLADPEKGVRLTPKAASRADETHAALALSRRSLERPLKDFRLSLSVVTEAQLREGSPANPWECFWLFFNAGKEPGGRMRSNYFIFKPNGIELGRAFNGIEQVFLATATDPRMKIGVPSTLTLTKRGQQLNVAIDGRAVLEFAGRDLPQALFDEAGSIGVYTEDARVLVRDLKIEPL